MAKLYQNIKLDPQLVEYIEESREPVRELLLKYIGEFDRGCRGSHPLRQREIGGLGLHTLQVIKKALELNQKFDRLDIIEVCLVHDLKYWKSFPLMDHQKLAIEATKGLPWERWRPTDHYRFVALILISDMWSAYVNEEDI